VLGQALVDNREVIRLLANVMVGETYLCFLLLGCWSLR